MTSEMMCRLDLYGSEKPGLDGVVITRPRARSEIAIWPYFREQFAGYCPRLQLSVAQCCYDLHDTPDWVLCCGEDLPSVVEPGFPLTLHLPLST
jgi:hypothetical protein